MSAKKELSSACCSACSPFDPHQLLQMLVFDYDTCDNCKLRPDTQPNAQFGTQVVMSKDGTVLAISAPLYDVVASDEQIMVDNGAIFIFERNRFRGVSPNNSPQWVFRQRLTQPDNQLQESMSTRSTNFGHSIALSYDGFYIIVGAPQQNATCPFIENAGAVFVFARNPKTCSDWIYITRLFAQQYEGEKVKSDIQEGAGFGFDVDVSGDGGLIVVGAPYYNNSQGATYIYRKCNGSGGNMKTTFNRHCTSGPLFQFLQKLEGPDVDELCETGTMFGYNVATSQFGDVIAIGQPSINASPSTCPDTQGKVIVYEFTRNQRYKVFQTLVSEEENSGFGSTVRITPSKQFILVSAPGESGGGAVYVFELQGNRCESAAAPLPFPSVFTKRNECEPYIAVARLSLEEGLLAANSVGLITSFDVSDDACVIAMGFQGLFVEAESNDTVEGGVVIFRFDCGEWKQTDVIRPFTKHFQDDVRKDAGFGASVSLSANSELLIVGEATELSSNPLLQTFAYSFESDCSGPKRTASGCKGCAK